MFSFGFTFWGNSCAVERSTFTYLSKTLLLLPCAPISADFLLPPFPSLGSRQGAWRYPYCTLPRPCRHTCLCTQAPLLVSPPTEGALELHTHHLIPSLRQVVFQGDRLPFQCSASYLGNDTRIRWYHNQTPVEGDEQAGILLAESLIHDCTFITRYRPCFPFSVRARGESGQSTHCPSSEGAMPRHIPESMSSV